VLTLGDPVAGWVGRRFGRVQLVRGRTLEGSLAFLAVGFGSALAVTGLALERPWPELALVALGAAVSGSVAELLSVRLDDNLTVPLAAAGGAAAVTLAIS